MDKRILESIFLDQKQEIDNWNNKHLCTRAEEALIDLHSPQAQVVIGVRRSGKSTLCLQSLIHAKVPFAYGNFDDERLVGIDSSNLNDILEVLFKIYGSFNYIFLDEIQNIDNWPLFVNRLLRTSIHVIITGSNARLLSTDLATHLTGRSSEIELFPFSFVDFCKIKKTIYNIHTTRGTAEYRALFDEYSLKGGFPELTLIKNDKLYVSNLVDNILKRDIEQRHKIIYPAQFENLANHLMNISPSIISVPDLCTAFEFKSAHTVRNYISYLKQAYLLTSIKKYSYKSKVRVTQEKLYTIDVSLMNKRENAFAGANLGWRLETIVLNHLIRKCKAENWDIYYLKERSGECDFIVCNGNTVQQCIQVSYDISNEKTYKRELNGLILAHKKTMCNNLLLLTDHKHAELEKDGLHITIKPVYEWCHEM